MGWSSSTGWNSNGWNKTAASFTWTPASLTNLVAWYKADVGVTTSLGNVTQVLDQSGNGNTLSPLTTSFAAGTVPFSATGFNGKPAFVFSAANASALGTGDATLNGFVTLPTGAALSVFFVGQMLTGTASFGGAVAIGHGGASDFNTANNIVALSRDSSNNNLNTFYSSGAINIVTAVSLATNIRFGVVIGGGTATHYLNNVAGGTAAATIALLSPSNIGIGNRWSGATSWSGGAWEGAISEVIIASSDITSDLSNLDTYLKQRWAL